MLCRDVHLKTFLKMCPAEDQIIFNKNVNTLTLTGVYERTSLCGSQPKIDQTKCNFREKVALTYEYLFSKEMHTVTNFKFPLSSVQTGPVLRECLLEILCYLNQEREKELHDLIEHS